MEGRHPEYATDWKGLRERKNGHLVGSESTQPGCQIFLKS